VPRPASDTRRGTHVSILQTHGRRLDRRDDEIRVTGEMAGPASTGGIAVALQQPRDDHPFEKGTEAVIEDCETLTALGELFDAVSCSTLDIREDVSVIDLLPYTTEAEMGLMGEAAMGSTFRTSVQTFCGKQPDVVLCAGRIWLPRHHDHCKGEAWKLESGGVGRTFDKYPVVILRGENREIVRIRRVNGFHLSYAMNYHLEYSYLRQLLLLVVAQTCSVYKGDWEEETWMGSLRTYCSKFSRELTSKLILDVPHHLSS
jgi:hypothetical protein